MTTPLQSVRNVLITEGSAVSALADYLETQSDAVAQACDTVYQRCGESSPGRVIVCGVR